MCKTAPSKAKVEIAKNGPSCFCRLTRKSMHHAVVVTIHLRENAWCIQPNLVAWVLAFIMSIAPLRKLVLPHQPLQICLEIIDRLKAHRSCTRKSNNGVLALFRSLPLMCFDVANMSESVSIPCDLNKSASGREAYSSCLAPSRIMIGDLN